MKILYAFLLGIGVVIVVRIAGAYAGRGFRSDVSLPEHRRGGKSFLNKFLYGTFIVILAATPMLSFVVANELVGYPAGFSVYALMAVGVFISLPLTLLIARMAGRNQYEEYWLYLESLSKIGRKAIFGAWVACVVITLLVGILDSAGEN